VAAALLAQLALTNHCSQLSMCACYMQRQCDSINTHAQTLMMRLDACGHRDDSSRSTRASHIRCSNASASTHAHEPDIKSPLDEAGWWRVRIMPLAVLATAARRVERMAAEMRPLYNSAAKQTDVQACLPVKRARWTRDSSTSASSSGRDKDRSHTHTTHDM
jgi:hypothetical protein